MQIVSPWQGIDLYSCDDDDEGFDIPVDDGLLDGWTPKDEDEWDPDEGNDPPDPPFCKACNGRGKIKLFTTDDVCDDCGGSGY